MSHTERDRRLRFYGTQDYGTYFQLERATEVLREFDRTQNNYVVDEILELYHAIQFAERDLFPMTVPDDERQALKAKVPDLHRAIGKLFSQVDDSNFASVIKDVDYQYHTDLLDLLGHSGVYDRCTAAIVLRALLAVHIHIGELLSCAALVRAYDGDIRDLLLISPGNAEHLIAKYLQADIRREIKLPKSLTPGNSRSLIEAYIDDSSSNPNFLKLIADARVDRTSGIDARLKLKAQRAYDAFWKKHFETNEGITTGCEVRISEGQTQAVSATMDGLVARYSYSRDWLAGNLDFPTILNNFIYVFEFSNAHMLLNFPSYYAQLGVFERFMVTAGKGNYRTGAGFNHTNQASILQTAMYEQFLRREGVELEAVLAWFFNEYIGDEFGAKNFKFHPASTTATYLEKSRHLFSEMESVLKQFSLYVENGHLDLELLAVTSEPLSYRTVPSLLEGKYVYPTTHAKMQRIHDLLFSDQAVMGYLSSQLQEATFAELIVEHDVLYEDFADHQKGNVDFLIDCGVVESTAGQPIRFANAAQYRVMKCLHEFEAASYHHYAPEARRVIDEMELQGWVERSSSLLTLAESSYYNFMLNQSEFSNGPDLRNRYLHGSQADGDDDRVHYETYLHALRLLIGLMIKINDDLELRDAADR